MDSTRDPNLIPPQCDNLLRKHKVEGAHDFSLYGEQMQNQLQVEIAELLS